MKRLAKVLSVLVLLVIVVSAAILYHGSAPARARRLMPEPNGWHDLHAAGQLINPQPYGTGLADLTNKSAILALLRNGLSKSCRMPPDVAAVEAGFGYTYFNRRASPADLLFAALLSQAKRDVKEGHKLEAVQCNLDCLRMLQEYYRGGGAYVCFRVMAFDESGAMEQLGRLIPALDLPALRLAAKGLEEIDAKRETLGDIWADTHFQGTIKERVKRMREGENWHVHRDIRGQLSDELAKRQRETRNLMISCATRAFQLERGNRPKSPADLVPAYLKAVPTDPLTGEPLFLPP